MKACFKNRESVASYVNDIILNLKPNYVLTTTIIQERSGDYCVLSVIDVLLDDIEMQVYSKELINIYKQELDG